MMSDLPESPGLTVLGAHNDSYRALCIDERIHVAGHRGLVGSAIGGTCSSVGTGTALIGWS